MITYSIKFELASPSDRKLYRRPDIQPAPEHESLMTKASRLRREVIKWHKAGRPWTPRAERKRRDAICKACVYFNPTGNFRLGECLAPGCGCSRIKTWLATSRCPLPEPKWGPVSG